MKDRMATEPTVLGIDTSGSRGALGLLRGEEVLGEAQLTGKGAFSEQLLPSIHRLLGQAGLQPGDLGLLAVAIGPGSFTGLRIGLATTKGLAYTLSSPTVGLVSLEILAASSGMGGEAIATALPARPGWLYTARYRCQAGQVGCIEPPAMESFEDWVGRIDSSVWLLGEGVLKYRKEIESIAPEARIVPDEERHYPRGVEVARLGKREFDHSGGTAAERLTPFYLQASIAEVRWKERQGINSIE